MLPIVLVLAGWFGYAAADRWVELDRSSFAPGGERVILCTVSAIAALTVHIAFA